ncbi:hypothetical protein [Zooshikella ganghwensis]|uniref:hypothetical protein n=1 Tax=Zooshikella ganghwensis TaxID=202772 RepID=UPI0004118901|nr:hypothetical protein [Zooshikella ganghwensis]
MFLKRKIEYVNEYKDPDEVKVYSISFTGKKVDVSKYVARLAEIKSEKGLDWNSVPAYAIFHDGEEREYLIFCWWLNGNELFHSVSVKEDSGWVEDASKYSFCVYDLEIMWAERNFYIQAVDCASPSIKGYRKLVYKNGN